MSTTLFTNSNPSLKQIRERCSRLCSTRVTSVTLPSKSLQEYLDQFKNTSSHNLLRGLTSIYADNLQYNILACSDMPIFTRTFVCKYLPSTWTLEIHNRFLATLRNRLFIKYNGVKTFVPLNCVASIFNITLNEYLAYHPSSNFQRYTTINKFPLIIVAAVMKLDDLQLHNFQYSAEANVKTLHSQMPLLFRTLTDLTVLHREYHLLYLVQYFFHFYHLSLHFTNPLAITSHPFTVEFSDFCASLVLLRPISASEAQIGGEYNECWDDLNSVFDNSMPDLFPPIKHWCDVDTVMELTRSLKQHSIAQIAIDTNLTVDPDFIRALDRIVDSFGEAVNTMHNYAHVTVDGLRKKFSAFISICYNLYRYGAKEMQFQDCFMNILMCVMQSDIPTSLFVPLKNLFTSTQAQSGTMIEGEVILKLLAISGFVLMVRKIPGKKDLDTFISRLDRVPKAISGVESMWKRFDTITTELWNWVEVTILGQNKKIPRTEILDSVSVWVDELSRLITLQSRDEIRRDITTLHSAGRMYSEGIRLMKQCKDMNLARSNMELIARNLPAAKLLLDDAIQSGADKSKMRTEPTIVWFSGASGNGKTGLTYPFILDMMRVYGDIPDTWQQNVYARLPETEFWDGYTDQEYIIYDDFVQIKDSQLKPNPELFEMIRLGNMFPYQCHMASITEKNNTFADPKMILMTSNLERLQVESLNCPEAVSRRIDFAFRVTIDPEYTMTYRDRNGKKLTRLDEKKARANGETINFDVYSFEMYDPTSGCVLQTGLTYTEVAHMVQNKMKDRYLSFHSTSQFLKDYKNKGVATVSPRKREIIIDQELQGGPWDGESRTWIHTDFKQNFSEAQIGLPSLSQETRAICGLPPIHPLKSWMYDLLYNAKWLYYRHVNNQNYYDLYLNGRRDDVLAWCQDTLSQTKRQIASQRLNITNLLSSTLGPYWNIFKAAAKIGITILSGFILYRGYKRVTKIEQPQYIKDKTSLYELAQNANQCLEQGCENCQICKNKDRALCVKWYTKCQCYAMRMEKSKEFLAYYSVASLYQEPETHKDCDFSLELLDIVQQMCHCDCVNCETCCDPQLLKRFENVAAVFKIPCVCICARLDQGFSLPELLTLVKHCGNTYPSPITNKHLQRLYYTMVSDIVVFEKSKEGSTLITSLQSLDDDKNMHYRRSAGRQAMRVHYQSEVDATLPKPPTPPLDEAISAISVEEQRHAPENDMSCETIVNHVVYTNLLYMTASKNDGPSVSIGHVLFVRGQVALMPYHFEVAIKERGYTSVTLYSRHRMSCKIPTTIFAKTIRIPDKDAILVVFPPVINPFKDIVCHFIGVDQYMRIAACPAILAKYEFLNEETERTRCLINRVVPSERDEIDTLTVPGCVEIVRTREYYTYNLPTRSGDCGAILVVSNTAVPNKIIGMHVSGIPGLSTGNSVALSRQMLTDALKKLPAMAQYAYPSSELTIPPDALQASGSFLLHSFHPKEHVPSASKSSVRPSAIFGELITSPNKPGRLCPFINKKGDYIDPMVLARKKYGILRPVIDQDLVDDIVEQIKPLYYVSHDYEPDLYKYPLTTEQAIVGIDGDQFICSLDRSTSPGYPYTLTSRNGAPGKTKWFGAQESFDLTSNACKELLTDIKLLEESVRDGIRPEVVWVDTMKDQKIPKAKADIGKTRLFTAAPMHYAIALRKLCLPFIAHIEKHRIRNSVSVGINPFSSEWNMVADRLLQKGPFVIAGDYSNFDGSLPAQLVYGATEILADWYIMNWNHVIANGRNVIHGKELSKEEFRVYVLRFYYECVHHLHITNEKDGTILYNVRNGIPSGCPITAIINSIVNHMALAYCWNKIILTSSWADKTKHDIYHLSSVNSFLEHTSSIFYGDDFVMNIRGDMIGVFNQMTITEAMKEHLDMVMTDEAKTGDLVVSRRLHEVTFLKRSFRFEDSIQQFVAPLNLEVILDSTNWVHIGKMTPILITLTTLEAATREISLHDVAVDMHWRPKIVEAGIRLASSIPNQGFQTNTRRFVLKSIRDDVEEDDPDY